MVVTTPDFSRAEEVLQLVRGYPGVLYCSLGVSPDLIKKNQDKLFEARMAQLTDLALCSEVVAISAGLDLTRDVSTHFLQHRLFTSQVELAARIRLPLVVHEKAAADKVIEAIRTAQVAARGATGADEEHPHPSLRVVIHAFNGSDEQLNALVREGYYIMLNGVVCDLKVGASRAADAAPPSSSSFSSSISTLLPDLSGDGASLFRQLRGGLLPVSRLLLCSDSPLHTPANIDDVHLRSQRNEPSNLPFVYQVVAKALRIPMESLVDHIDRNTRTFFQLSYAHDLLPSAGEESKEERKEPTTQPAPPQAKKAQKGKVAFSAEAKGGREEAADQEAVDDVARQLEQQHLVEEDEEGEEDEGEDEEGNGEEADADAGHRRKAKGESNEDEEESADDNGNEDEEEESSGEDRRPLSSSSSSSALPPGPLIPAGRRRSAKTSKLRAEDDAADDDWDTSKGRKKKAGTAGAKAAAAKASPASAPPPAQSSVNDDGEGDDVSVEAAPKRGGSTARKSTSTSSRQRVIGSDVNLSLERDIVRYACKRCRTILFTEDDLVPHRSQQSAAAAAAAGDAQGEDAKGRKGGIDEWERTQCQQLFVRPMVWMSNLQLSAAGSGSSSSSSTSAVLTTSERVECGECGYKLGRCGMVALYLPCSCGRQCDGPPPYFSISLSRVDPLEHSALLKAPRAVEAQFTAQQAEAQSEAAAKIRDRKAAQMAKSSKRTKRQQKEDQRGNFTSAQAAHSPQPDIVVDPCSPALIPYALCCSCAVLCCLPPSAITAISATRTSCTPRPRKTGTEKRTTHQHTAAAPTPPPAPQPTNKHFNHTSRQPRLSHLRCELQCSSLAITELGRRVMG